MGGIDGFSYMGGLVNFPAKMASIVARSAQPWI